MNILKSILITLTLMTTGLLLSSCSDSKTNSEKESKAIAVTTVLPFSQKDGSYFSASGQIEAEHSAQISTRNMGYVSGIYVKVGDHVNKGQALIDVNNSDLEAKKAQAMAARAQAEAGFLIAEKDYKRFSKLHEQNSASQKELDDITTQYKVAKAQVEAAKQVQNEIDAMLAYSNIKAPFSGTITAKMVDVGDLTRPGEVLLSLEEKGNFIATARVSERNIKFIKPKDSVRVNLKSENLIIDGIVTEVSSSSQHTGGQYLVKIRLNPESNSSLYSGMFVSTMFAAKPQNGGKLLIPESALVRRGGLQGVYTVSSSNTAVLRWLKLGKNLGGQLEVLSGLSSEEQLIVSAEGKLYNGAPIQIK